MTTDSTSDEVNLQPFHLHQLNNHLTTTITDNTSGGLLGTSTSPISLPTTTMPNVVWSNPPPAGPSADKERLDAIEKKIDTLMALLNDLRDSLELVTISLRYP